jgi:ankyrin repeat protein
MYIFLFVNVIVFDYSGFALLHYCCLYDLGDLVGLLLCKRATDINLTTSTGVSALHLAAGAGNLNIVLQLLRHGADPRVLDQSGHTPAQYAAEVSSWCMLY